MTGRAYVYTRPYIAIEEEVDRLLRETPPDDEAFEKVWEEARTRRRKCWALGLRMV